MNSISDFNGLIVQRGLYNTAVIPYTGIVILESTDKKALNGHFSHDLTLAVTHYINDHFYRMLLGMQNVEYVGEEGWGEIMLSSRLLAEKSGKLGVYSLTDRVREQFRIKQLSTIIEEFKNLDAGITAFTK